MVKQAMKDRRNWERAKRVLSIQFRLVTTAKTRDTNWALSTTQDMSVGGLSFYTDRELRKNDIIEIHVSMSGILDIFKGKGKVVRIEKKRNGAHFLIGIKYLDANLRKRPAKIYSSSNIKRKAKRI